MNDGTYKLEELARAGGTSARTVRYYVQRGLLPAPEFKGKDTAYRDEHLVRLRAIRRLQELFFPLDAIAAELEGRSFAEIGRIADGHLVPSGRADEAHGASETISRQKEEVDASFQHAPGSSAAPQSGGARLFRRIELAPGVELTIAEDAPLPSKRMAEAILHSQGMSLE